MKISITNHTKNKERINMIRINAQLIRSEKNIVVLSLNPLNKSQNRR